jgi:phosphopantothenoylcysteine decarboxylase/phosphopantothenate--cysteine ligase
MDGGMFEHPATVANLDLLRQRGAQIIGPAKGHLASGLSGVGRMVEPLELMGAIRLALAQEGPLRGYTVLVTAGGTQEPLDPVRVVTNRSSGKQGFALAQAALDLGAKVTLISATSHLQTPYGAKRVDVSSAGEMLDAVLQTLPQCDILIMAAAVADFRPARPARDKIKKSGALPQIVMEKTEDILQRVSNFKAEMGKPRLTIGFAAESRDLLENARAKLVAKNLDMIVANDISAVDAGFNVDTNRVTLLFSDGSSESLSLMAKDRVAQMILARIVNLVQEI